MLLYTSPLFLEHDTRLHPESAERLRRITSQLDAEHLAERCTRPTWQPATLEQLSLVHARDYPGTIEQFAREGGGRIEQDTIVSPRSYEVAVSATGAVCDAATKVLRGDDRQALCLTRPPGHHALRDEPMGFCLFNHVAVGARWATQSLDVDRALIVDWDVHHGNGTQNTFWRDGQTAFLSIHRHPFYPGTGRADERGEGPGQGLIVNLPTRFGVSRADFVASFRAAVEALADKVRPQLVIVSAGFDAHRLDPVGSLGLETEDYATLTRIVWDIAKTHAGGRVVSVLEGGYHVDALADSVALHVRTMLEYEPGG